MTATKPKLSGAAIAGAILILLWAFLIPYRRPGAYYLDWVCYVDIAASLLIAVGLFCRARTPVIGIGFLLLCVDPAYSLYLSDFIHVNDSLQAFRYILPMLLGIAWAVGMAIVCFRRIPGPKAGPWVLPPLFLLLTVLLYVPSLGSVFQSGIPDFIFSRVFFMIRNTICFVGLLLTAISFQKGDAPTRSAAPSAPFHSDYAQPAQNSAAPGGYEEAEYDILDD